MSSKQIIRLGLMAGSGLAMMGLTACASGHSTTRYGGYDYEKGQNCGSACVAPAPAPTYTTPVPVSPGPVYVDCTQIGTCGATAPAPTTVYTAPTTSYGSGYSSTYSGEMADCPAGTTPQADGTCMQSSSTYSAPISGNVGSYTTGGTVIIPDASPAYSSTTSADCPAGTTMQADGTCMQGSSYGSYSSSTTYSAPTTTYVPPSTTMASCPSGTVMQADGSCMQSGYQSSGTTTSYRPLRK